MQQKNTAQKEDIADWLQTMMDSLSISIRLRL